MRGRLRTLAAGVAALALTTAAPAGGASLYDGAGPRPGPDVLYEPLAKSPQLENTGIWKAEPILVSGTTAYRDGEFLYQDFLYDDHGARFVRDPADPRTSADTFSQPNGTYTYPTKPEYAGNAADIVEIRIKPLADATAFRLTLNTLIDPELTAATIAIGDSAAPLPVPNGANATTPAQLFLTWHGSKAELRDATTGTPVTPAPTVAVDRARRQIEIRIPHSAWNPGTSKVNFAAATGLWDSAANAYLTPSGSATADRPGGAGPTPAATAFFNVAFRTSEPLPSVTGALSDPSWWRDRQQGTELRSGNLGAFRQEVDFAKLATGATDNSAIPTTGPINRILVSHHETKQGIDFSVECGNPDKCEGELRGRLQPYAIYVPEKRGTNGYGLTLLLHSLGASYNQFHGTRNQSQFAERGSGSIVLTPSGRGPDGWYFDHAGADTFEAWADVAGRYPLDPTYTAIAGYSMGGYGTYKFTTQYPDLFAMGQPTVGPPGLGIAPADPNQPSGGPQTSTTPMLPSLRNIPFEIWNGVADELVPIAGATAHANAFDAIGLRYEFKAYANSDHFALAIYDQYQPAADFLGDTKLDRDPPHVTYVRNPKMDFPGVKTVANHAYWLSDVEVANADGEAPRGTIDVRSEGFGSGDPEAGETQRGGGALTGGTLVAPIAFTSQKKTWGTAPQTPKRDRLAIEATNIRTVTINPERARVSCKAQLDVTTDSPLTVKLAGCDDAGSTRFGGSAACGTKGLPRSSVARRGLRGSRARGITANGRAIGFRCANGKRRAGTVKRVQIAIARRAGRNRCQYLKSNGRLGKRRACTQVGWITARRGAKRGNKYPWTLRSTRRLPRGTYDLRVRAIDGTGTVEKQPRKQSRKTIKIK